MTLEFSLRFSLFFIMSFVKLFFDSFFHQKFLFSVTIFCVIFVVFLRRKSAVDMLQKLHNTLVLWPHMVENRQQGLFGELTLSNEF